MSAPEFSRVVDLRHCDGRKFEVVAKPEERARLAERFDLVRIDDLKAALLLRRDGDLVHATGSFEARWVQTCALSAEDLPVSVSQPLTLRFVPAKSNQPAEKDLEIDSDDADEIEYSGTAIDLGEAVAQSLALAIDPFATGPAAAEARERLRAESDSPFAALAALKRGGDDGAA
ncbi:MAG: DUF177 domain-containing protein [Alphaproteobacteria bacterium]|nr:DUF177 domain-containing protein [Alphaproteobacteria bacterium]